MLTILTPTYNRGYILDNAYKSLLKQKNKNFEWLIIDDGSSDNTKSVVDEFIKENKIKIRYYKKLNGGKHTAVNYGVRKAMGEYILILDSDDYLVPVAVKEIEKFLNKYKNYDDICGLSFLKQFPNKKIVGKTYKGTEIISNNIDFRYNKGIIGDMAEVYKTEVLKKYPFPIFKNEKFLSEAIVWNKIAFEYKTVYINMPIYVCEYLDDGLSKSCLKSRIRCPIGAYENAKVFLDNRFILKIRLKNSIIYTGFSLIKKRKIKDIINYSDNKLLIIFMFPFGFLFYIYLRIIKKKENIN